MVGFVKRIRYKKLARVYKYVLCDVYHVVLPIWIPDVDTGGFVRVQRRRLSIRDGYAWDGPSGPAIDTRNTMRASLVHDALYQLLRAGKLAPSFRKVADKIYRQHLIEDGVSRVRAGWQYAALRLFGGRAARREHPAARVFTAP